MSGGEPEPPRRPRRHRRATRPGTGTPLPGQTKDDTDEGWGEAPRPDPRPARQARTPDDGEEARDQHERWLLDQRPPHWD